MAHQLEQLLTCCICLDRFRNPKLLPCQHSVCMEPCMEGLVDYVRRQVKCPECRAEHRIPYNGVQGFPTNVTLQRFLEAHIEITGETPDPHTGQYMERCSVCNEKAYLSTCVHCDKKVCPDCKAAHTDILKREIGRINNQVKRAAHRLAEQLGVVEKNITSLKVNIGGVTEEVDNISKRLQKAVRDRCDFLKSEVENYYNTEFRNLTMLKEGLEQEISNVDANIDLAEKHMDDQTPWDDAELMDTKEIFLRTMEFIRSFDYEPAEYSRRARFNAPDDLNKLVTNLTNLGDLVISHPTKNDTYGSSQTMSGGLMKSKSDHRLAAQFRDQEDGFPYTGRTSPVPRRRFGERPVEKDEESETGRRKFRSRFMNRHEDEERSVRFSEEDGPKQRNRVIDTEDVSRGPLSGITRLYDSPRVIKRLQERDTAPKKKKDEGPKTPTSTVPKPPMISQQRKTSRQTSNEDEIDKIKKQNKAADPPTSPSSSSAQTGASSLSRPAGERVSSLKDDERQGRNDRSSVSPRSTTHSPSSASHDRDGSSRTEYNSLSGVNGTSSRTTPSRKSSIDTGITGVSQRSYPFSRSSSTSSIGESKTTGTRSPRSLDVSSYENRASRSNSTDSNKSHEGSSSPKKMTGAAFSTDELKSRFLKSSKGESTRPSSSSGGSSNFSSRFLGRAGTPTVEASKESTNEEDEEEDSSEDSESDDSEESSEEDDKEEDKSEYTRPDIGLLLGRSAYSRDNSNSNSSSKNKSDRSYSTAAQGNNDSGYSSRYGSNSDNSSSNRYGSNTSSSLTGNDSGSSSSYRRPSYLENKAKEKDDEFDTKYPYASKYLNRSRPSSEEEPKSTFQSRFLNKSKSSAVLGPDNTSTDDDSTSSNMGTSRARFEELKERRQRLARSKSSAGMDEEDATIPAAQDTANSTSYRSRYSSRDNDSSSTTSPRSSTSTPTNNDDGGSSSAQLSTWARYLKNKYGNKSGTGSGSGSGSGSGTGSSASSSTAASNSGTTSSSLLGRSGLSGSGNSSTNSSSSSSSTRPISRSRSSHLLGLAKDGDNSEDDSKNVLATPTSPQAGIQVHTPFGSLHKSQYLQKQRLLFKIGSRGSEPGSFTWPRGIAVGPDNSIVIADSSNHRVQVFDANGKYDKSFGSYGSGLGEFDCLAGVAVNRIGQYIIADRYNHRVQVFDPSGMFLRSFGSQGCGDGKFSYPWGITTDSLGFIYVCDKENHRIQVFQSDGTFVGKFGSMGKKPGQLEHPHYIAVSTTNRVIVSDSNNHRIQIFDVNGKLTSTFGEEGSAEGQFKFPRGVGVDDQGYIFVADSGNNRIQMFQPDGGFLRAFGCWGSEDGEFKGLEGVAIMSNGNILVCDRENHRVQAF